MDCLGVILQRGSTCYFSIAYVLDVCGREGFICEFWSGLNFVLDFRVSSFSIILLKQVRVKRHPR